MKFSKTLYWNKRNGRLKKKYLLQETASEHELKNKSLKNKLHCSYEYIPDWKWICIWEHMNDYQILPKMEDKCTLSCKNETIRRNVRLSKFPGFELSYCCHPDLCEQGKSVPSSSEPIVDTIHMVVPLFIKNFTSTSGSSPKLGTHLTRYWPLPTLNRSLHFLLVLPVQNSCEIWRNANKKERGIIVPTSQRHDFLLKEVKTNAVCVTETVPHCEVKLSSVILQVVRAECNALCEVSQLLHRACFSVWDAMALFICWSQFSIQSFSFHKPSGRLTRCLSPDGLTRQSLTSVAPFLVINCECFSTLLLLKENSSAYGTENHPLCWPFRFPRTKAHMIFIVCKTSETVQLSKASTVLPASAFPSYPSFPVFYLVSSLLIHALTLESLPPPTLFLTCKPLEWYLKQQNTSTVSTG